MIAHAQTTPRKSLVLALLLTMALPPVARAQDTAAISTLTRGIAASVIGTVDAISDDDEFLLADATGQVRVYIGPNPMPVRTGDRVTVRGVMDDDPGPLELYARQIVLADGRTIDLAQDD